MNLVLLDFSFFLEPFNNMRFDNLEENYGKRKVCESFRKALLAHITCT